MAYMGMDVDAVEQAGRELKSLADQLRQRASTCTSSVTRLAGIWQGQDSSQFANQTWPGLKSRLEAAAAALEDMGQIALSNATEQRQASNAPGSPLGTIGGSLEVPRIADTRGTPRGPELSGSNDADQGKQPGDSGRTSDTSYVPSTGADNYKSNSALQRYEALRTQGDTEWNRMGWGGDLKYQCTSWAAFRRQELGLSMPNGNGYQMAGNVGAVNPESASTGSLVSTGAAPYGHVMVVEERLPGKHLTYRVSEMNVGGDGIEASIDEFRSDTLIRQNGSAWEIKRGDGGWTTMGSATFSAGISR